MYVTHITSHDGESPAAEMNELRTNIKRICQSTLPMDKVIEFVLEDLDAWPRKKCDVNEEEKTEIDEALQPLQVQLLEVEELMKGQVHTINMLKGMIAKNTEVAAHVMKTRHDAVRYSCWLKIPASCLVFVTLETSSTLGSICRIYDAMDHDTRQLKLSPARSRWLDATRTTDLHGLLVL